MTSGRWHMTLRATADAKDLSRALSDGVRTHCMSSPQSGSSDNSAMLDCVRTVLFVVFRRLDT